MVQPSNSHGASEGNASSDDAQNVAREESFSMNEVLRSLAHLADQQSALIGLLEAQGMGYHSTTRSVRLTSYQQNLQAQGPPVVSSSTL